MFHLPNELIKEIFEFDNTYRCFYKIVMSELASYGCRRRRNKILCPGENNTANNTIKPTMIKGRHLKTFSK